MVSSCSYSQIHGAKKSDVSSPTQKNTDKNQTRDVFQKHLQFVLVRKHQKSRRRGGGKLEIPQIILGHQNLYPPSTYHSGPPVPLV